MRCLGLLDGGIDACTGRRLGRLLAEYEKAVLGRSVIELLAGVAEDETIAGHRSVGVDLTRSAAAEGTIAKG